jgi:hypothetical protein
MEIIYKQPMVVSGKWINPDGFLGKQGIWGTSFYEGVFVKPLFLLSPTATNSDYGMHQA